MLIDIVGMEEAHRVIDVWCTSRYTDIYKTLLRDFDAIGEIVRGHELVP